MKTNNLYRFLTISLIITTMFPVSICLGAPIEPRQSSAGYSQAILERLTPEEKVGQLFLVTFTGPEAGAGSATGTLIYNLISNHHVGGVILQASNDNFMGQDLTIPTLISLVDQLQRNEYSASLMPQTNPVTNEEFTPAYIPLFIAISQDGDGYPYDQLLSGLTPLPSQMALGATWNPELSLQVGNVLGSELTALGINMLLGPSLDVLQTSYSESGGDLGIRSFGGDPFWVGEMGQAFITGLHQGGGGELAVIAKHFPGFGGSNRLPEDEVATVRSSLEQLKQIELAPFFAVTGNAPSEEATTDGLLVSHIRYQGFQGNIRATTRPVSFDTQALSQLLALPEFTAWRQAGGITISDDLGSRAVRRFYDPTGQTFNGLFVARDAFLAGNDLLYLGNFLSSGDEDSYTSIIRTLAFFAQKYREDTAFAQRVDESVARILNLKYRLYNNAFSLTETLPETASINSLGLAGEVTFDVARQAATLISPPVEELNDTIPSPPGRNDNIVFITDTRLYQQCSYCRQQYTIEVDSLANAVIRFYSGSGQVLPGNLTSYSFQDLTDLLNVGSGVLQIENDLRPAEWVVFLMSDVNPNLPSSQALRRFLDQRPDLQQNKNIIVFAVAAPYYLDTTDISKLTAYYALYSRSNTFVEVAARLLFKEIQATGDLPVTVTGVSYDLIEITSPDPTQTIHLSVEFPTVLPNTSTPESTSPSMGFRVGDTISLTTDVIVDHNGHRVPDGTPVRFMLYNEGESNPAQVFETQTTDGVAHGSLRITRDGELTIRAESEPAEQSDEIIIEIVPVQGTPTQLSPTPEPTLTPSPSPTATEVPTVTPTITPTPIITTQTDRVKFGDWLLAVFITGGVSGVNYWIFKRKDDLRWAIRGAMLAIIGGFLAYTYLSIGLPGSQALIKTTGTWGVLGITFFGAAIGVGILWLWYGRFNRDIRQS
jgi:beta-N-acetylhexosaminidase